MKRFRTCVALIAIVIALVVLLWSIKPPPETPLPPDTTASRITFNPPVLPIHPQNPPAVSSASIPPTETAPGELASHAASPIAAADSTTDTNESANLPPLTVLDKARVVMHNYRAAFGENPVGTNPEITAALMGKNPKQINFVADSSLRVNEKGEMLDAYGTPFFFHQISGQEMEIRSAGQDRVMWTGDDLVTR